MADHAFYCYDDDAFLIENVAAQGKHRAAIRLEELWNELAKQREFSLLCGYLASDFEQSESASSFEAVCACHTQVIGRRTRGTP